ncbi:HEAT repeat domain-containing protein [Microcoleus sp. OTE_8_concoct_300]|uniref:HEAT repeat domain-containing protein n=1 Tax=Microcoleus sp. OTE_8_concoct_300 TaxID=2964710 RepID=UPI00403F0804
MAYYRSFVCFFTCIACLGAAFSPSAEGRQQVLNASYRAVSQEIAQANSPPDDRQDSKPSKPSPAPDKNKSKPSQTSKSSKLPKAISNLIVILSNQRGFLMLGLAAIVVTAAAVFIMLKLVSNDESNHSKRRRARVARHKQRNSQFNNPDPPTNSPKIGHQEVPFGAEKPLSALPYPLDLPKDYSLDRSDRSLPLILESGQPESQDAAIEGDRINSDTSPLETHSNGYSDTGFNIPETTNRADSLASRKKDISVPETDGRPKVDIIEALIEDLQHLNPALRRKAIWELGQRGDSRAVEPLLDLLANSDSNQYSLILASLSEIGIRTLKPMNNAWSISLHNENPEVRKNAIRDLTRIYELVNQISYLLHRATDDPDPEVQETARWAINQLNRIRPRSGMD